MTGPNQQAHSYGAEGNKTTAFNPASSDKCFLCGNQIGETAPRQFWGGPDGNAMMLAHTPCLRKFETNGYQWPNSENKLVSATQTAAVAPQEPAEPPAPASDIKAANVRFDSFQDMQAFISARGSIPASCNVFVGEQQVQTAP